MTLETRHVPPTSRSTSKTKQFKVLSRRDFLKASGAILGTAALAACSNPSEPDTPDAPGSGSADDSILRVGMEVAYAPYNWQTDTESEFTIPVDGLAGAFADGYDVQIARYVAEGLGREAVAVKLEWDGIIDACMKGSIDVIIAGMTETPERSQSIDFSEPYFSETYGLFVQADSEWASATTLADLSGAAIIGQKDTIFDEIIDEIPGVNHLTPAESEPAAIAAVVNGTADGCTFPENNRAGFLRANPTLAAIDFAEGEGFPDENSCNIGLAKGQEELLSQINEILASLSQEERDAMWEACCDRQPV